MAFAAAWIAAFSLPAFAGEVSCEGFELGYNGAAKRTICKTKDASTAGKRFEIDTLDVRDHAFWLWVAYYQTKSNTILHPMPVDRWLANTEAFSHIEKLGVSRHIGEFEVVAFKGVPIGGKYLLSCGFFSHYFGRANRYGPGVFRNLILGIYCAEPGYLPPEQDESGFYDVVEQVIGKLRLPPMDE